MKRAFDIMVALAFALAAASPGAVLASPATDAFSEACAQNPGFFSFAVDDLASQPEAHSALCGCLVTEFGAYSDADIAMLTKDVDDTATAESRTAYGDYPGLESKARDALGTCIAAAGLGVDEPAPSTAADMANFDASCQGSKGLLEMIGGPEAATHRATLCQCLSSELSVRISSADATVLGQDLDDTATVASRGAHPGYQALTETAGTVFGQCFEALALPLDP